MEVGDIAHYPWLLAHYKTSMETKWQNFDNHGQGQALGAHSLDQASMGTIKPSPKDVALSKRFPNLSPGQIAICRGHLESLAIQYVGWNDTILEDVRISKVKEINRLHGPGLADILWKEVVGHLKSLFKDHEIYQNHGAWQSMLED